METLCKSHLYIIDNKPEEHIELYKREKVIEYINDKLEAQNIVCAWEVKIQMIVICSLEENIATCTKIIDESVREIKFPISKESSATLITQEWKKEKKQIQDENEIVFKVFSDKTSTNVSVIATDKAANETVCRIKTFLKGQLDITSEMFDPLKKLSEKFQRMYALDSTLACKMLDLIAQGLSLYHVTIKQTSHFNGSYWANYFTVTGTQEGRRLAKKRLNELNISF